MATLPRKVITLSAAALVLLAWPAGRELSAQTIVTGSVTDKWVTVIGAAAGETLTAKDQALAAALRKAVEQTCGTFLKAQSQTKNYKLIYDKVFASTVGFVRKYEELRTWTTDGKTFVRIRARVSTQKFQKDWATIAHTVHREGNPRVIIVVAESTVWTAGGWKFQTDVDEAGGMQSKLEDFFLSKGIVLMDRQTAKKVSKRDLMLATIKDDTKAIAAIGARFKADVVITGKATAKYTDTITIPVGNVQAKMHKFIARLNIRAIQTDSARLLVSKPYDLKHTTTQRGAGTQAALEKLADSSAPKLLAAVVEAWRKRAQVSRSTQLTIGGMDFATWKRFKAEVKKLRGVQGIYLRGIVEDVATVDIKYSYNTEILADRITELRTVALQVIELTPNRLTLKVDKTKKTIKQPPPPLVPKTEPAADEE